MDIAARLGTRWFAGSYLSFMAVRIPVTATGHYFITFTCYQWLPLIDKAGAYDEVEKFLRVLNRSGHTVTGYVIMPNHVHFTFYYNADCGQPLNTVVGNGKRFIGYEVVRRLQQKNETELLVQLTEAVDAHKKPRGHCHKLWEDTFDVKECRTERYILQKLNYMHRNPCAGKWRLCEDPNEYPFGSAGFYELGRRNGNTIVTDYRDLLHLLLPEG